jgi:hypothetical protein
MNRTVSITYDTANVDEKNPAAKLYALRLPLLLSSMRMARFCQVIRGMVYRDCGTLSHQVHQPLPC